MTRRARWDDDVDLDRTFVVVPAVMGVGLLFSVATVLRDAARSLTSSSGRVRRTALAGRAAARAVVAPGSRGDVHGFRSRPAVAGVAAAGLGLAALLVVATTWSRLATGVSGLPVWLWAVALAAATGSAAAGLACAVAVVRWPDLPPAVLPVLRATGATARAPRAAVDAAPEALAQQRRRLWRWLVPVTIAATATTAYVAVADTRRVDDLLLRAMEPVGALTAPLAALDPLGVTELAVGLSALVGLATWRCRPFAATYVAVALGGWGLYEGLHVLVVRVRPDSPTMRTDAYPSGHVLQGTVLAGLVALAVAVLLRRWWLDSAVSMLLGTGVVAMAVARVRVTDHWPLDVVGSLLIGTALVLAVHLVLAHPQLHARCRDCPWVADPAPPDVR